MKFYLIGGRGRLGQAIAREHANAGIWALDRSVYASWSVPAAADIVSRYFEKVAAEEITVFVASGLLDPNLPEDDLLRVNYHLPRNLIDGAARLGIKVVTFGTAMETLVNSQNPYVRSKAKLGEYVRLVASAAVPAIHLQIHTLYGAGQPSSFMFLGQMLQALCSNDPFKMTSGLQLREYHHVVDDAKAIRLVAESGSPGVTNVGHGKPLSLKAIAESVFEALGKSSLLQVGAIPNPPEENYARILPPPKIVQQIAFRDSLPAIVEYMKACYFAHANKNMQK